MTTFNSGCNCGCAVTIQENEDRGYSYDVGGELKETIPFTKELREWLQSFIAIGGRGLDTFSDVRALTKHYAGQIMICFENYGVYQYQLVSTTDDGENVLKPDNVYSDNTGRWILKGKINASAFNLWNTLKWTDESTENETLYVDNDNGTDSTSSDGTQVLPYKTIGYAIDSYVNGKGYWKGVLTIILTTDYTDKLELIGLIGNGMIIISSNNATRKVISTGDIVLLANNQVDIRFDTCKIEQIAVLKTNLSLINSESGTGNIISSEIKATDDSILTANCIDSKVTIKETLSSCTISESDLWEIDSVNGSAINVTNCNVVNSSLVPFVVIDNCNLSKGIPKLITEYIGFNAGDITVKGIYLESNEPILKRGLVYADHTEPTVADTKIEDTILTIGVFEHVSTSTGSGELTYVRSYITTESGTYYGNEITYINTIIP